MLFLTNFSLYQDVVGKSMLLLENYSDVNENYCNRINRSFGLNLTSCLTLPVTRITCKALDKSVISSPDNTIIVFNV